MIFTLAKMVFNTHTIQLTGDTIQDGAGDTLELAETLTLPSLKTLNLKVALISISLLLLTSFSSGIKIHGTLGE